MGSDRVWRAQRAVGRWVNWAICAPDDHGLVCVALVVLAGLGGFVWGLATQ